MTKAKQTTHYRALVLGVDDRSALAVVRSLGRRNIEVHLGKDVPFSVCEDSRYTRRVLDFPHAGDSPAAWVDRLVACLKETAYDLVIPTADNYLVLMVQHRSRLEPYARLALPDEQGFIHTYKKSKTLELAREMGVPCPKTVEVQTLAEAEAVLPDFRFPVIVKPISSKVWQQNARYHLDVELARNPGELQRILTRVLSICPVLIQSFHPGIGIGQEFLMNHGELVAAFQHQRVHEPLGGGGSSYRKSVPIDSELLRHSLKMLRELQWTGVAMVEYKYDPATAESVLMEINGRFWGSLPLAVAAGVDFPGLLFDLLVKDQVPKRPDYRTNVYARNPVKDLDWLKENLRADKRDPFNITVPLPRLLGEVKNLLLGREYWDTIAVDDPRPGIRQLRGYLGENVQGASAKLSRALMQANHRFNPFGRWNTRRKIRRRLRKDGEVAFVCKGNICRSPFADLYLKSRLRGENVASLRTDSYGLIERVDRPSPELAVEAAQAFGVDMEVHRSKLLAGEVVERSALLFVMDIELYRRIKARFPAARSKLFFLGALQNGNGRSLEILDPYGQNLQKFKTVFSQISDAVDTLIRLAKN